MTTRTQVPYRWDLDAARDLGLPVHVVWRALRRGLGLGFRDTAATVGVSRQALSKWESGKAVPTDEHLVRLLALLRQGRAAVEIVNFVRNGDGATP